jgi:hypothetical protein
LKRCTDPAFEAGSLLYGALSAPVLKRELPFPTPQSPGSQSTVKRTNPFISNSKTIDVFLSENDGETEILDKNN